MAPRSARPVGIDVDAERRVSGLLEMPAEARCCYVLAHGAGAGMAHPFMAAVAVELAERSIATLRYQFPYMEQGGKRPDPPALAQATVRAAIATAGQLAPGLPLIAGGKSFGGRMTSQAQAASPLAGVRGLAFLGFPLHPAGKPSAAPGGRRARQTGHPLSVRQCRPFVPRPVAQRPQGCRRPPRDAGCAGRMGGEGHRLGLSRSVPVPAGCACGRARSPSARRRKENPCRIHSRRSRT